MAQAHTPPIQITSLNKGLGGLPAPIGVGEATDLGWNILREEVAMPAAVLYEERLEHNLRWMQAFIEKYELKLAPHGKTTMSPKLFQRQLAAGAWGITVATAHQAHIAHAHGVRRVLMANELVGRRNFEIVSELIADATFSFFCLVDSAENVEQLGHFFGGRGQRLSVLLELGVPGGRTGVRTETQESEVLAAIAAYPQALGLAGVEVYEGVLKEESDIRDFLRRAVETFRRIGAAGSFNRQPAILSGAGSAWYDVVADEFSRLANNAAAEIVLRPGCYLTHDVGIYKAAQEEIRKRNPVAGQMGEGLLPALQLWAVVQSIPETGRAIMGLGKRDAAFDSGLPEPALHYRPGSSAAPRRAPEHWSLTGMMDQHAYLATLEGDDLRVGDMIAFDISHPCLTFDKWRQILVVDGDFTVTDVVQTYF